MIIGGVVLFVLSFAFGIPILWSLGIIIVIIGVVLLLAGSMGHPIAGRRHYF